jgi:hypothetical protein
MKIEDGADRANRELTKYDPVHYSIQDLSVMVSELSPFGELPRDLMIFILAQSQVASRQESK